MKRILIIICLAVVFGGLFQATAQAATVVTFPDANLETVVRDALGKPTVDITDDDMLTLTHLYGGHRGIVDLQGLEYATNLTYLRLYGNSITDITPVRSLTNLTYLQLQGNSISDITPLQGLTSLTTLYLNHNSISDLRQLQGLSLTSLTDLDLSSNSISDITGVENLTNLTRLYLNHNSISDLRPLQSLTSLTDLRIFSNSISDITGVENLTNLVVLWLQDNSISDIGRVENLTSLVHLYLGWNQISDITAVEKLTKLTRLQLISNQISDIAAVRNLTNLTTLWLQDNSISDITPLENLTKLTSLHLYINSISDITGVENLTKLMTLHLGNNSISDITPLENLTNLTSLHLFNNSVSVITPLENLTKLTYLTLYNNSISVITPLENLTNLTRLYLMNNSISDITPLVVNSLLGGLGTGDYVYVQNNYLDLSQGSDDMANINDLEAAGAIVLYSPQKPPEPDIDVSPLQYDFGDVAWLSPSTVIVTITNTGGSDLVVSNLNPVSGPWGSTYSIDNPPILPVTIPAGGTIDLQIRYTMFSLGPTSAVLEIESDDPDEGVVQIALSGNGVMMEAPPDEQIQAILDFFDESVGDGSLVGEGPGGSANGRLNALRNMIEASGDLIQDEDIEGACQQLQDIYNRVDGIEPPPDFVSGSAAQSLASIIQGTRGDLGCQ